MGLFDNAISILENLGFFSIVLPFLLVYSVIYGILVKTEIFGKEALNVNAMVAFTLSLLFIAAANVTEIMVNFIPWVGLISIFIVCLMMISVMVLGTNISDVMGKYRPSLLLLVVVSLVWALIYAGGWMGSVSSAIEGAMTMTDLFGVVLVVLVVGVILWVSKSAGGGKGGSKE